MSTADPTELITTKELAELLKKTPNAVRIMRHYGTGPRGFRTGRGVRYQMSDVRAWMNARIQADADKRANRAA